MRTHSKQTGRPHLGVGLFQSTIQGSLRRSRLGGRVREDLGNGHAENYSTPHRPLSQRTEVLVIILMQLAARMKPNLVEHAREIHHALRHFFRAFRIRRHARVMARIAISRRELQCGSHERRDTPEGGCNNERQGQE